MAAQRSPLRPDIEGLRGVAILLVVLFHAGLPALAGGFVGVDVFFVLSGFFITGLLLRELAATGDVSLTEFWGRRAVRLLAALLVVLVATLLMVMTLWAPIDRAEVAANARAVALGGANVAFASDAVNYFRTGDNPLLHTWSLAVEQQFYLVWPLLLLFVAVMVDARRPAPSREVSTAGGELPVRALLATIALVGVLSFVASVRMTESAQSWAFFGMPTRMWEFALGAALAVWLGERTRRGLPEPTPYVGAVLQAAGLVAVAVAVARYSSDTPYPGTAAVLPALGAVLLVVGGQAAPDSVVSRLLGAEWLRWFGRLSYAWYLWHWPLVGLGQVLDPAIGVLGRLLWSALGLALAWITWRWVEEPSRNGGLARVPAHWLPAAALGASTMAAVVAHGAMVAAERRAMQADQRPYTMARVDRMPHDCWVNTVRDHKRTCEFGDTRSNTTVVLFGDSHAEHWLGALDRAGKERGWKIVLMVKGGCPVADIPQLANARRGRIYRECVQHREASLRRIVAMRPAAVVLSSWDHYVPENGVPNQWQVTPDAWYRGMRATYARLAAAGIPTVALRGTPRTWFDVPACLSRKAAGLPFAGTCEYTRDRAWLRHARDAQTRAARGLPVRIVDMNDQICPTARCATMRNGIVVFTDDNHLTASFTRSLAPVLGPRMQAAMTMAGARVP